MEMRAKCRRLRAEQGLGLVVVDYLQLIRGHGRIENRNQEISIIARSLKGLARELQVPRSPSSPAPSSAVTTSVPCSRTSANRAASRRKPTSS